MTFAFLTTKQAAIVSCVPCAVDTFLLLHLLLAQFFPQQLVLVSFSSSFILSVIAAIGFCYLLYLQPCHLHMKVGLFVVNFIYFFLLAFLSTNCLKYRVTLICVFCLQ